MPQTSRPSTRDAILERAVDLASAEGLEGLTIGRLAAEMEMSKSGLFRHFGAKEDLQLATIDAAARRFISEVVSPALERDPGLPRLRALSDLYLDHLESQVFAGGCFWGATAHEFDDRPGAVRDAIAGAVAAWLALLTEESRNAGVPDADQFAFELQALAQGANLRYRLFGEEKAFTLARSAIERRIDEARA